MSPPEYPVFTKRGDARAEVDALLKQLKAEHGASAELGFEKYLYVTRADMTVVMVTSRDALLASALRRRTGWEEPRG